MTCSILRGSAALLLALLALPMPYSAYAQNSIDPSGLVDTSIRALLALRQDDKRGGRALFGQQLSSFTNDQRRLAVSSLISKMRTEDAKTKIEVANVLASVKSHWMSANTDADVAYLYGQYLETFDETLKNALDSALANAQGLYRDGIDDYNTNDTQRVVASADKFKAMADKFPKSRYAENASFYFGQQFTKAYFMNDSRGKSLIDSSSRALENYILRAERGDFIKTEYLAGGYFFRALNGVINADLAESRSWLNKGSQKFSDTDRIYIYQLFYSSDSATVVDKFLPAKTLFSNMSTLLARTPDVSPARQIQLLSALPAALN